MYKHPAHYATRNARVHVMLKGLRFHEISRHRKKVQYSIKFKILNESLFLYSIESIVTTRLLKSI